MTPAPDFALQKTFHCRRCHCELPMDKYISHYKECPGRSNPCKKTCPPTSEPIDQSRKSPDAPGHG